MNVIKGFAQNRTFVNNTPGVVAGIGELSPRGYTFAKEPRPYFSPTFPTISLIHMPSKGSGVGFDAQIPDDQRDHILTVINTIYQKSLSNTTVFPPGDFLQYLLQQMGSAVANVSVGGSVVYANRSIVEWVQWNNPAVDNTNINKVWFSDPAFVGQFDEYDTTVIPPFTPVSLFFGQPADVKTLIASRNFNQQIQAIDDARAGSSETFEWGNEYNYVNPVNANDKTPAKFVVLGYGEAANNLDIQKQSIVDYLLAQDPSHNRDQWKQILPDLFLRSEFMLFPQWDRIAIPNVVGGPNATNSPILDAIPVISKMQQDLPDYDPTYISNNAQTFTFPFQSVGVTSIGNTENRGGQNKLSILFPDYFFTNSTSADFNRMTPYTQNWVLMIAAMMLIARDMTTGSTIPLGYSRVTRGSRLYLVKSYDNIQYFVAAPAN